MEEIQKERIKDRIRELKICLKYVEESKIDIKRRIKKLEDFIK